MELNKTRLNLTLLNLVPLNGAVIRRKPSGGGGTTPDIPDGYEQFLVDEGVFLVDEGAFSNCTSMQYYDFSTHESVPTLQNTYVFNNISSTCKIIVPDVLYDEWIAAKNWSTYASYIIKKSDWDASQTTE